MGSCVISGVIEGAVSTPYRFLAPLDQYGLKSQPILTSCNSGHRSIVAASLLSRMGLYDAKPHGGTGAWEEAGLSLSHGTVCVGSWRAEYCQAERLRRTLSPVAEEFPVHALRLSH